MPDVLLKVRGQSFAGWEEVYVARSMQAVAGTFSLTVSDRAAWPIRVGDSCELWLDGEQLLSGHVDRVEVEIDAGQHRMTVQGRDATADLVDCAPLTAPQEWIRTGLVRIATDIAAAVGVSVAAVDITAGGPPFDTFALQPGETAWEAIERACRMRAVLAMPDGAGRLLLTQPSTERTAYDLELGRNVLALRGALDHTERFRRYRVRGQHPMFPGADDAATVEPFGDALDLAVRANREVEIISEGAVTAELAEQRAQWEATWRAARSATYQVRTAGWRQGGDRGPLWPLNRLVRLRAELLELDEAFLIAGVAYRLAEGTGAETELELGRRDAFLPQEALPADGDDPLVRTFRQALQEVIG